MRNSRNGRATGGIALAVSLAMVPGAALASGSSATGGVIASPTGAGFAGAVPGALLLAKKKKKSTKAPSGTLTPEAAEPKREAIRAAVSSDVTAENWKAAADETESNAILLGDPITYQEAAEYRYNQAKADRDIDAANDAIEMARVALDIMHFYESVAADEAYSEWQPIAPAAAGSYISDAEAIIENAEELIAEIEAEREAGGDGGPAPAVKEKRKREKKPGVALIAIGSAFTAIGAGGLSMVAAGTVISSQKQKEVESLVLPDDQAEVERLDEEGSKANLIAYIGAGVAVAGLAVGVPLIVVGVMKRKKGGSPPAAAKLRVVPAMSRSFGGVTLQGRF
ncbi:MAG: hypothetical protein H6712_21095 [Myxococcales bacterium]|nr:hypothetical protein [Myxococcales bacterium]MCB9716372.1 hypothetical protein [Myxococcales bacterium]